jgi:hypothetical protein
LLWILLKREEAISVLKELLDSCTGLDGHSLELMPTNGTTQKMGWYQIIIRTALDEKTRNCIQDILMKHQLTCQIGSMWKTKHSIKRADPDTLIIYRPHNEQKR